MEHCLNVLAETVAGKEAELTKYKEKLRQVTCTMNCQPDPSAVLEEVLAVKRTTAALRHDTNALTDHEADLTLLIKNNVDALCSLTDSLFNGNGNDEGGEDPEPVGSSTPEVVAHRSLHY